MRRTVQIQGISTVFHTFLPRFLPRRASSCLSGKRTAILSLAGAECPETGRFEENRALRLGRRALWLRDCPGSARDALIDVQILLGGVLRQGRSARAIISGIRRKVKKKDATIRLFLFTVSICFGCLPAHSAASDSLLGAAFSHKSEAHLFFRVALLRSNVPHFAKIRMGLRKD